MRVLVHSRRSWRPLGVAAGALVVVLLAGCSKAPPAPEPVRAVKLVTVGAAPRASAHEYAGEVKARVESRLGFRVTGKLVERHVELGQPVRAGQLLARLDAQDYQLAVDAARAQTAAARTQRDLAAADFRRYQALRAQNFISGAELERREALLTSAQAALDQAQAQLVAQGHQAGYTQLLADAAGVVTAVEAEVGQVLSAGTPVLRIARDGARDVVFAVPEDRVAAFRRGQPMQVRAWQGGAELRASVRELAASADPVTRTFTVKLALADTRTLPLGATVTVRAADAAPAGPALLKLPTTALFQQGAGTAVWVLAPADMTVHAQPVEVTGVDGQEAVIGAGLQPGQEVVVAGVHTLSPGQKVVRYQPNGLPQAPAASTAPASR